MTVPRNNNLTPFAKSLRKNMTKEERHLWYDFLRFCEPRFRRQEIIGGYIADFFCHKAKLVIELDGSQHFETPGKLADHARDAYLLEQGLTVLRYANSDLDGNFEGVCQDILSHFIKE